MPVVRESHVVYMVQPGDTLYLIAMRLGSSVEAIRRANAVYPPITDPDRIEPGWLLVVPTPAIRPPRVIHVVAPGDTLYGIARRYDTHVDLLAGVNRIAYPDWLPVARLLWVPAFVHEIAQGDTMWRIARHYRIPMHDMIAANEGRPGFSPDLLYPGFRLLLPLPSTRNIAVTLPLPGDLVQNGDRVEGFARAFEANVLVQLRDDNGETVSRERAITAWAGAPAYAYFTGTFVFDRQPTARGGYLWVYTRSPRDGRIADLTEVRIEFGQRQD